MEESKIEWTETTWNPVTGCTKISCGCKNCYAKLLSKRLKKMGKHKYRNGFSVTLHPDELDAPLKWKDGKLVFVNSMSDLFHKDVPLEFIQQVFETMNKATQHTFQILTKRSERLLELSEQLPWSDNIWMGVSVEDDQVVSRIDHLSQSAAKHKFLSIEPLLGPIPNIQLNNIDWVIVGGESGPKSRLLKKEWVIDIRERCLEEQVPFFFKQWGNKRSNPDILDFSMYPNHPTYAKGGCQLDGEIYREMPPAFHSKEFSS